jgi:hypothetical protein
MIDRTRAWFAGRILPLRLRHGMFWSSTIPSPRDLARQFGALVAALAVVLLLLVIYAVADLISRNGDLAAQAAQAEGAAVRSSAMLADCLNGRARFLHPNNSGRGHGMTAVVCEPAYSVEI